MSGSRHLVWHALSRGCRGMAQTPVVQLLSVTAVAVCMSVLVATSLLFLQVRAIVTTLGADIPMVVYLEHDVAPQAVQPLIDQLHAVAGVTKVRLIDAQSAMRQLTESFADEPDLLAGLDANVLPMSLEVSLSQDALTHAFDEELATRVRALPGVDSVDTVGSAVSQFVASMRVLERLGGWLWGIVSLATLTIVWLTVRLGLYGRQGEVTILRLVGGTARFVRGPFVVEGVAQGVLGSVLALVGVHTLLRELGPVFRQASIPLVDMRIDTALPWVHAAVFVGMGALMGWLGARAATSRVAEA